MDKSTASSIGAVLLLCCTGLTCANAEYCDPVRVKADQTQCFTDLGISVAIFDTKHVLGNNSDVCRYQDVYKAAVSCAFDVSKRCLSKIGEGNDILSEAEQVMQIISSLCSHANGHLFSALPPLSRLRRYTQVGVNINFRYSTCSDSDIRAKQQKCYNTENIRFSIPAVGSAELEQSLMDSMLLDNTTMLILRICRSGEIERYKRAVGCAVEIARKCLSPERRGLTTGYGATNRMISEMCSRVDDINYPCVTRMLSKLYLCGYRLQRSLGAIYVKNLTCNFYQPNVVCLKEVLHPCGCKTTSLYVKMIKHHVNPTNCPTITEGTPVCEAGTDRFISMGAQSLFPGFSVAALLLTACLSVKLAI